MTLQLIYSKKEELFNHLIIYEGNFFNISIFILKTITNYSALYLFIKAYKFVVIKREFE